MSRPRTVTEAADRRLPAALAHGELEVLGALPDSSNAALLVRCHAGRTRCIAVYKPMRGETPLWDFPDGTLHRREVAAFALASALGWPRVPPTVLRDGPYGPGRSSCSCRSIPSTISSRSRWTTPSLPPRGRVRHRGQQRRSQRWALSPRCRRERLADRPRRLLRGGAQTPDGDLDVRRRAAARGRGRGPRACPRGARRRARRGDDAPLAAGPDEVDAVRDRIERLLAGGRFPEPEPGVRPYPWPPI